MRVLLKNIIVTSVLTIAMLACGAGGPAVTLPTILPPTTPPLVEPIELKSSPFNEESQSPVYTITAQIPYLDGSTDASVQAFNTAFKNIVDGEVAAFRGGMAEMPLTPISAGSSLDIQHELVSQQGSIWSIKFNIMGYADGAAHPYHYSITVNYDLANSRELILDDLFLPNSNYLQVISDYCKVQLSARDIGFTDGFAQGADPVPENYRNWNISNEGLVITFDEYQVAAYAVGAQTVVIPFSELGQVVNLQGPLAPYLP